MSDEALVAAGWSVERECSLAWDYVCCVEYQLQIVEVAVGRSQPSLAVMCARVWDAC